jgi:glycosyltransferase involved in cell wall biosynthesis
MVRNLAIKLNKTGIHTDVLTFNMTQKWKPKWNGKTEKIDGITVFKIPALNWQPLTHSFRTNLGINLIPGRFTHILKQYDIIHYNEFDLSFPLFSYFLKKPKIFHLHGLDANLLKRYHLSRIIFNNVAHFYIAISKAISNDLLELGIPESKVTYLPNGIDTELFHPKGEKEENLILFVGRISFGKGLHVLLKSLHYLQTSIRLAVIGPFWDSKYSQDMKKLAEIETLRGKHKIEFLGALDQEDIIEWYQKASVFILPSFTEGLPVVVLEALSCETPVIVTPVG